jgi:hypothetical protein
VLQSSSIKSSFEVSQKVPIPPEAPLALTTFPEPFFQNELLARRRSVSSSLVSWIRSTSGFDMRTRSLRASSFIFLRVLYNSRRRTALFNILGGGGSFRGPSLFPCGSGAYHFWNGVLGSLHYILVGLLFSFLFLRFPSSRGPFWSSMGATCFQSSAI